MRGRTILVVDDEPEITDVVRRYLEQAGYRVTSAADGRAALAAFHREKPHLVLLDLMLPEVDGWEVARRIRAAGSTPIIMLTARGDEVDRLVGLGLGADDYITKPFSPREVVARVRAVLRRTGGETASEVLAVGDLTIDLARMEVRRGDAAIALTATEFRLLAALARAPGRVFTRLQLIDLVYGHAFEGYERTIDAHIKNLRQKLEPEPHRPRYILTVHGAGYRLAEPGREPAP
ncbi:MAG: response regulator transcription factor [Armatimonadota bacterium]|nr:response regulator transcription factor [Armatimonadota bacterium]MDR7518616.1 response regulator transcription factor [Armatimonadota bacterium]MDR7548483.1 response regulator transcription factor [Armatimonadota bacterium]